MSLKSIHPFIPRIKHFFYLWMLLLCLSLSGATVDPEVATAVSSGGTCSLIIVMNEQADLSLAGSFSSKEEKAWYVFDTLKSKAELEQAPVLEECRLGGYEVHPFWIVNMILVEDGDESLIQSLSQNPYVWRITGNRRFFALPETTEKTGITKAEDLLWNLNHVQAPEVWAMGVEGEGIVVGSQDTGYEWDHTALRDQYRGYDRGNVNHDYCWHDSIHVDNYTCPGNSPVPCADGYHGTHTMGTVLGQTDAKTIGVAPAAKWIGCRNMEGGWGTPSSYIECFQWFLAPTRINGSDADPLMAPDVMVNSWGCPEEEGCIEPEILRPAVQAMLSAGIFVEVSAGNEGPGCGSVSTPPSFYDEVFSVGATDVNKHIATFSSRGFVDIDGSYRMKPDISAPGVDVYSCVPGGGYAYLSGTSMAGPHVAGVVALILSAVPELRGQVETVIHIIQETAEPLYKDENCGGRSSLKSPNPTFGYGLIQAKDAIERARALIHPTEPAPSDIKLAHEAFSRTRYFFGLNQTSNIYILGLSDGQDDMLISMMDHWGSTIAQRTIPALKKGEAHLFPITVLFPESTVAEKTYSIIISGNQDFTGINYTVDSETHVLDAALAPSSPSEELFIPHIASNEQWDSTLTFFGCAERDLSHLPLIIPEYGFQLALFQTARLFGTSSIDLKEHVSLSTASKLKQCRLTSSNTDLFGSYRFYEGNGASQTLSARSNAPVKPYQSLWIAHSTPVNSTQWFTGTAIANPNAENAGVSIYQYDAQGTLLSISTKINLPPWQQGSFTSKTMGFEANTAYFQLISTGPPILATHIFGTEDRTELCAIPAIPVPGWTQISGEQRAGYRVLPLVRDLHLPEQFFSYILTNPTDRALNIIYQGLSDSSISDEETLTLLPGEKRIGTELLPQNLMPDGQKVESYLLYSDGPILASVLNGSHQQGMLSGFQAPETGPLTGLIVQTRNDLEITVEFLLEKPCLKISLIPDRCVEEILASYTQNDNQRRISATFPISTCLGTTSRAVLVIQDVEHTWNVELVMPKSGSM